MGKVFSLFRRKKEAPLDVAEEQLRDLNRDVSKEEIWRNALVASRRKTLFRIALWGLLLVVLAVAWAGAALRFDWVALDGGYIHLLPALISPILLFLSRIILGSCYDFRIRRSNYRIGKLQTRKAKVVDDLENSEEFKRFLEQKRKWDALQQLKKDPVSTPVKSTQPPPAAARTPSKAQATATRPVQPPTPAALPPSPAITPAPPLRTGSTGSLSASGKAPAAALSSSSDAPPQTPSAAAPPATPTPAPVAATPKTYYQPVMRASGKRLMQPPAAAAPTTPAAAEKGFIAWLGSVFIGDEGDDRYTAVPLMCQFCGAQNGLRENTHFKTAYYEFNCRSCHQLNQLRSAESLSDILAFANDASAKNVQAAGKEEKEAAASAPAQSEPKTPQAKKYE